MKRQKENTTSLVYAYGIIPPWDDPHVQQEVERSKIMWDALVDLEHEHQQALDKLMQDTCPDYRDAVQALREASQALHEAVNQRNKARSAARSRQIDPAYQSRINEAGQIRNQARRHLWDLAKKWRKDHQDEHKAMEKQRRQNAVDIRRNSGLYWSNYNQIMDNFEAARSTCMKKGRRVRHRNWLGDEGFLTCQIQRTRSGLGAAPEEIMDGTVSQIQVGYIDPHVWDQPRAARTRNCRTVIEMRVDAAGHMVRCPVWFHRPLPEDCRIKKAQISWKRCGETVTGNLCLTLSMKKTHILHPSPKAAGVDLGWRLQDDGSLLVATTMDTRGDISRYALPAKWMSGMDQVERLGKYISDGLMEVADYLYKNPKNNNMLMEAISEWKPGRGSGYVKARQLHDAVRFLKWRVPREVLHWYRRYRHLSVWRDNLRAKLLRRRREIYRLAARDITINNAVIGIEDMDLSKMARTKKRSDAQDNALHQDARANRVRACVHALRSEIEHQAGKHGTQIIYATAYTTMRCRDCGQITEQARREDRIWTCKNCGAQWDQDQNAAGNLLAVATDNADVELLSGPGDEKSMNYDPIVPHKKEVRGNRAVA